MPKSIKLNRQKKQLENCPYQASDYQITINWSQEDQCFLAEAPALKGCISHGSTPALALKNGLEAIEVWLMGAMKTGDYIPAPPKKYSGKLTLRLPASLHQHIVQQAEREGVSINQWAMSRLAR